MTTSEVPPWLRALCLGITVLLSIVILSQRQAIAQSAMQTVTVVPTPIGITTHHIGVVEGNVAFKPVDLADLGMNTYRIYGGIPRWEASDDDRLYGYPTIAQIKANPNLINWAWWDQAIVVLNQGRIRLQLAAHSAMMAQVPLPLRKDR